MRRILICLMAVGLLSAAVGAPTAYSAQAEGQDVQALTLADCLDVALGTSSKDTAHPRIMASYQNAEAAGSRTDQSKSTFWPQVGFTASRNHISYERTIRFGSENVTTSAKYISNDLGFGVNWLLFDFGRRYNTTRSLYELEKGAWHDYNATQQAVAFEVMEAYFGLLKAQQMEKVALATKDAAELHLKRAQAFFDAGSKPRYDVTNAEVEQNDAILGVIMAKDAVKLAAVGLNTKLGRPPLSPIAVEKMPPPEGLVSALADYLTVAFENRPELASYLAAAESADLAVRVAGAEFMPTISASANQGWNKEDHTDFLSSQNVQFTIEVPIFEGFRTVNGRMEAKAKAAAARYRVEDLKRGVELEVSKSYLDVEDAKARTDMLVSSVKKAKENLEIAEGRYEVGVGPIIEVTDARVAVTKAETDLTQAEYDYHIAYARLMKSIGKVEGLEASN